MSEQFLGELRLMSFANPPKGWARCEGQTLNIAQNQALFSLLGTTYGGNGVTTFQLPDLRGRTPMHPGSSTVYGSLGGQEAVSLTANQIPAHTHTLYGTSDLANANVPGGALPAAKGRGGINRYLATSSDTTMEASSITPNNGGQPHSNMQPFLTLQWAIALVGIFPSRN